MLGSLPLSLNEVTLAPAILAAKVKKKGHHFHFLDINLELYEFCHKNTDSYHEKVEYLCSQKTEFETDSTIVAWTNFVVEHISHCDILLLNVFSHRSHSVTFKFIQATRNLYPNVKIIVGGIGSHKIFNYIRTFDKEKDKRFGQMLLDNNYIDFWQEDVSASELDKALTTLPNIEYNKDFDYEIYDLDRYEWEDKKTLPLVGSFGCVRQCSFCDVITHFPKYSFIEADSLSKQIVEVHQQTGVNKFSFMDSLVNGSMKNFENLLRNLAHSKNQGWLPDEFEWSGTYICRPPSIQLDRIHELLKPSGAHNMVIGVETGSDKIRFEMDKKFTNNDLLYELDAFEKNQLKAQLLFFPAWPTETPEDFEDTLNLYKKLSKYGQNGTVESINTGGHGFSLLDGTPIDRDKHLIQLEPGPLGYLWKCHMNPDLNFWEALRRRLLLAKVAMHYGLKLPFENHMLRVLNTSLVIHKDIILDYTGKIQKPILNFADTLSKLDDVHKLKFSIINSGTQDVIFSITVDEKPILQQKCCPGFNDIEVVVTKKFFNRLDIKLEFRFSKDYSPIFDKHPNGEYFSKNGIYLDTIHVDYKNIALWGFEKISQCDILDRSCLPGDFYKQVNPRCIVGDTNIQWNLPTDTGFHSFLWDLENQQLSTERKFILKKLQKRLEYYQ